MMLIWLLVAKILWSLQGRPVNADFRLEINVTHYENPAHRLESGSCCENCCLFCCIGCTSCDNFFVFGVHEGTCGDAGCELWGTFDYHYGGDDSTTSRVPMVIVGRRDCPLQPLEVVIAIYHGSTYFEELVGTLGGTTPQLVPQQLATQDIIDSDQNNGPSIQLQYRLECSPARPTGIRALSATTNSITLTWSPAAYADYYVVTWNLGGEEISIGTSGESFTIPDLVAGSSYTIKVTAHNNFQDTDSEIITGLTVPGVPNVTVQSSTQTTVSISWSSAGPSVANHVVTWRSGSLIVPVTIRGDVTCHTISGLSAGRSYVISVRADNAAGSSEVSTTSTVTVPSEPISLQATTTATTIFLVWSAAGGSVADSYTVMWSSGQEEGTAVTPGTTFVHIFTGLEAGSRYSISVSANNAAGSAESDKLTTMTAPGVPIITSTAAVVNEIVVSWSSAGPSVSYEVQWQSGSVEDSAVVSDGSTCYTISGLEVNRAYTVSVTAENEAGSSESDSVLVNTRSEIACPVNPPPTSPTITVQSATASTILLTWSIPSGSVVDNYDIEWRSGGEVGTATTSGGTSAYSITGLNSATSYAITVAARNAAGSAQSNTVLAVTVPARPEVTVHSTTSTRISVAWSVPPGSVVDSYVVVWGLRGEENSATVSSQESSHTIASLEAGSSYGVSVVAMNAAGSNESGVVSAVTAPGVPIITLASTTQTTIFLCWTTAGSSVDSYTVRWNSDQDSTMDGSTSYTITGLESGTSYSVRVTATNAAGSNESDTMTVETVPSTEPSSPPRSPTVTVWSATASTILLTWSVPSGSVVDNYDIEWRSGGEVGTVITSGGTSAYSIAGLNSATSYAITVAARNAAGSAQSNTVLAVTVPARPEVTVHSTTSTRISVAWSVPPGSVVESYVVVWGLRGEENSATVSSQESSYTIASLEAGSSYGVSVVAMNAAGSNESDTILAVTVPGMPIITLASATQTTIFLCWTTAGSPVDSYTVRWNSDQDSIMDGSTSYAITGLEPGTAYSVRVTATNAAGSNESDTMTVETEPSSPPRSPTVTVQSVTDSTILLTWSVPSGSVVDNYDIEWRSAGEVAAATISGETPVYTIRNLNSVTRYAIVVTARNAAGSTQSNVTTISTTTPVSHSAPVSEEESSSGGLAIGAGVGVGIAVVGTAAVAAVVILFLRRKKKRPLPPIPGSVTIIEQPNPIYEVPVPSHNKQDRGGISEDDNALRYSNRMSLNVSYNTQSQIKQELQQQIPPAGKEREGGEGDGSGGSGDDGGRDGQDKDSNDEDDYEEYMN